MKRRIWLLGGTGKVGGECARQIASDDWEVITISRRVAPNGDASEHVRLDLAAPHFVPEFQAGDRIVNLTEATAPRIVAAAITAGSIFIETSATPDYVKVLQDRVRCTNGRGQFVACVGVAPGLTNLMAHRIAREHLRARNLVIACELGLGVHAGQAATRWFFESLGRTTGQFRYVYFGIGQARLPTLNFPFVEREILADELAPAVESVQTYLAVSPSWITRMLGFGLKLGLGGFLAKHAATMTRLMLVGPAFGKASTRVAVCAFDAENHETGALHLSTGEQGRATAAVIIAVVRGNGRVPAQQITTIADWLTLNDAIDAMRTAIPETELSCSLRPTENVAEHSAIARG